MTTTWYEVWADESWDPPYILLLCASELGFRILDPSEGNRVVFEHASLEVVREFLIEDEYTLVDGRMAPHEPG